MCGIGEIVEQNLDSGVRERFPNESHDALVVFQELMSIIGDSLTVVFVEQTCVFFLLRGLKLCSNVVLFADKNELPRGGVIFVLQKVMHPKPEVVQVELAKVFPRHSERIEIVFLEVPAKFSAPLLVFAPNETGDQKNDRRDD